MDRRTTQSVVFMLGLIALATVVGAIVLAYNDKTVPDSVIAIGSAAAGAVAALLARPPADTDAVAAKVAASGDVREAIAKVPELEKRLNQPVVLSYGAAPAAAAAVTVPPSVPPPPPAES